MFDHYRPAFRRCSPFFPLFRRPAYGRAAEKWKKRRKGLREGTFLVAKQSLRWGRPSGGGTKPTDREPDGVVGRHVCNNETQPLGIAGTEEG
jgi:hypothetical protein